MQNFLGAAALAMVLVAAPAYATTTFAQFEQKNNTDTVSFGGGALSSVPGSIVSFNFLDAMPPAIDGQIDALMTFTATGGGPYGGTLSFLRVGDNANLLTVTFGGAQLSGTGTAGSFLGSEPGGGAVSFTSDFLDFSDATANDFGLSFSALSSAFGSPAWTADATGTFASDSSNQPGGNVPEPATWAMMIIGLGGVGALMRRRRTMEVAFA